MFTTMKNGIEFECSSNTTYLSLASRDVNRFEVVTGYGLCAYETTVAPWLGEYEMYSLPPPAVILDGDSKLLF